MKKLFAAKEGNWPYYVAANCVARGPVRSSRVDVRADVQALGSAYRIVPLLTKQALPLMAADEKYRGSNATA